MTKDATLPPMATETLSEELELFAALRRELVAEAPGQFVLIKGKDLIGKYPTPEEALSAGYERYGLAPFLVRQITERDVPLFCASLV